MLIGIPNSVTFHTHDQYLVADDAGALVITLSQISDAGTAAGVDVGPSDGQVPYAEQIYTRAIASGTVCLFHQTAAPTGWTKLTNIDNSALRVVNSTISSGGSVGFNSVFGTGKTTDGHAITISQMPSHDHFVGTEQNDAQQGTGDEEIKPWGNADIDTNRRTSPTGGNAAHSHTLSNLNLKYIDVIRATKD